MTKQTPYMKPPMPKQKRTTTEELPWKTTWGRGAQTSFTKTYFYWHDVAIKTISEVWNQSIQKQQPSRSADMSGCALFASENMFDIMQVVQWNVKSSFQEKIRWIS